MTGKIYDASIFENIFQKNDKIATTNLPDFKSLLTVKHGIIIRYFIVLLTYALKK